MERLDTRDVSVVADETGTFFHGGSAAISARQRVHIVP